MCGTRASFWKSTAEKCPAKMSNNVCYAHAFTSVGSVRFRGTVLARQFLELVSGHAVFTVTNGELTTMFLPSSTSTPPSAHLCVVQVFKI